KSRSRSRSPYADGRRQHRRHHHRRSASPRPTLPYNAQRLSKRQYDEYKPLFQSYLDIQKHLNLDELDDREARGRWKSFVSHWNRGDLARSWYDPSMLKTAKDTVASYQQSEEPHTRRRSSSVYESAHVRTAVDGTFSESDDEFGPAAPKDVSARRTGPTMPKLDDLALRDELRREDETRAGSNYRDDIRFARKQERKVNADRLEELVPRADPGSRERQLEKKRETTTALNDFRNAKDGGDVDVPEADLMGTDDLDVYKRSKNEMERKKNEREIRREEIMRARAAEREEKLAEIRQKEAATMEYLKALAKDRFG
ncbi:hypothetical protein M011DRAFT_384724, partial [Sporormia fimetaria CBS 119925]